MKIKLKLNVIQGLSQACASGLASKVPNTLYPTVKDQIEVYSYGFQVIIGMIIKLSMLIILALIFHILIPALIIMLTFASFRILAGGYHFGSYSKCIIISIFLFIASASISQHIYKYLNYTNLGQLFGITFIIAIYIIIKYVPRDNPNKRIILKPQILKFKRWSTIYLFIWTIFIVTNVILGYSLVVISSCLGLLLELFGISKFGYNTFKRLENKL